MKQKETFLAKVPISDHHVYSFIVNRYGSGEPIIHLNKKNLLGTLIELSAEKIGYQHALPKGKFEHKYFIEFRFSDRLKNRFLSREKLLLISEFFDKNFKDIFLLETEIMVSLGISDYEAVERFMEKYGIVEDATIADTLRKRWRDKQKYLKRKYEIKLGDLYPEKTP